jgi:beta-aspartyl-peptidase (threonine type)
MLTAAAAAGILRLMTTNAWRILIHGGAGVITREKMTGDLELRYREALGAALNAGAQVLAGGGDALDAASAAVVYLEDDPLFNAGRGSVFTHHGTIEMDAAVMHGADRSAGAVCAVTGIRNPVLAAGAVREDGTHVLLNGAGAERFAREQGLDFQPREWFETEMRRRQLEAARRSSGTQLDHDGKFGTVGAVALDVRGNLAAATSTGGMTNKQFGRIGDSPLIGSGTYADNRSLAVSATGQGEAFIRAVAAYRMAAMVELAGADIGAAGSAVLGHIARLGGSGGLIALDAAGNWSMPFDTEGMFRGMAAEDEAPRVGVYRDESW